VLDLAICEAVAVSQATVERIRKRFVEQGLDATLDLHRPDTPREHETDGLEVGAGSAPPPPSRDRATRPPVGIGLDLARTTELLGPRRSMCLRGVCDD
jgi:hypothetical protein